MKRHKQCSVHKLLGLICFLLGSVSAAPSFAVHGAWFLSEAGMNCNTLIAAETGYEKFDGATKITTSYPTRFVCPIALAGRQTPSEDYHSRTHLSARSRYAAINVIDNHALQDFHCQAIAKFKDGSESFSAQVSSQGTGPQTLILRLNGLNGSQNKEWGGDLQNNQHKELEALSYFCVAPAQDENNWFASSAIIQYSVALCYGSGQCTGPFNEARDGSDAREATVSVSANECYVPHQLSSVGRAQLHIYGWKNIEQNGSNLSWPSVLCPISVPAQDSYPHRMLLSQGVVTLSDPQQARCVVGYPGAQTGSFSDGVAFEQQGGGLPGDVFMNSVLSVPIDSSPVLKCDLAPGQNFYGAQFNISRTETNQAP
ncbi:hypothetical protein [Agaribacterium haliotis]|uniref:hypothetical protein n=1 Tax=Agaribacterium haliotis TaxID=2013869 RepID=UPI0011780FD1|nr:hypothetical protein [Agaribacterium haliotis]